MMLAEAGLIRARADLLEAEVEAQRSRLSPRLLVLEVGGGNPDEALPAEKGGEGLDMSQYCGDDYDRTGCTAAVEVTKHGYKLTIRAPNGAWMESYGAKSADDVACMVRDWCAGKVPGRRGKRGQPSSSGS